jgi:DNA-binding transcriptional ArsR family regulator
MEKELQEYYSPQLPLKSNENIGKFQRQRSSAFSNGEDQYTRRMEIATYKILRAFMEQGTNSAMELVKYHIEAETRYFKEAKYPDDKRFKNAIDTFKTLEELIDAETDVSAKFTGELYSPKKWLRFEDAREEEICERLAPLSHAVRLKILKDLWKGGKYYSQLERETGARGGHLQFHLNNLVQAGYVTQEKPQGKYLITGNGLIALKFSYELDKVYKSVPFLDGLVHLGNRTGIYFP